MTTVLALSLAAGAAGGAGCGARQQHNKIQQESEALRIDLAELYVTKGVSQAAVPLLQKILADNPRDVRARVLYGEVERDLGLYPQATRELHIALKLAPREPRVHAAIAILLDLERRHAEALRFHRRSVALAPGNAAYHNNTGFSLYLAGDTDAAIVELERALAMDPGLTIAYNNLGFAYGRKGQLDRAERAFRAGLGEASTLLNLAMIEEERGEAAKAADLRARAYAIDPDLRPVEE
ncbi:MAG TPA: tetratricopeptide repeat protein [Kofleriaceae bacterium]|nr:tetratricopeptide repeat protein [Kofleriaceae bacterium]